MPALWKRGKSPLNWRFWCPTSQSVWHLGRAADRGIPTLALSPKDFASKAEFEAEIVKALDAVSIDLVALAGYMRIVGPTLLSAYQGRIVNLHPALLPAFPGAHAITDALRPESAKPG